VIAADIMADLQAALEQLTGSIDVIKLRTFDNANANFVYSFAKSVIESKENADALAHTAQSFLAHMGTQ